MDSPAPAPAAAPTPGKVAAMLTFQFALFTVVGALLWRLSGRDLADFVRADPREFVQGLLLGGMMIVVAWGCFRWFPRLSERLVRMQAPGYSFFRGKFGWPLVVLVSVGAGVGEEALFRGGVQTLLGDYVGIPAAILIASALFGLVHRSKPLIMAVIVLIGALFGTIFAWTGSLLTVMVAHAIYDVFALHYLLQEMRRLGLS